jgi:hypothetical protein
VEKKGARLLRLTASSWKRHKLISPWKLGQYAWRASLPEAVKINLSDGSRLI